MTSRIGAVDTETDIALRAILDDTTSRSFTVVAGAGSGKTTSLVKALHYIGQTHGKTLLRNGKRVACVTYTEGAVKEILSDIGANHLFQVSTIHSFLWDVIKPFQQDIAVWVARRIEQKISDLYEHNNKPRTRRATIERNAQDIRRLQTDLESLAQVKTFRYGTGSRYSEGTLGHQDVIDMTTNLILSRPLLRRIIARRYPYLFVDESQDTFPSVIEAILRIQKDSQGEITVGFFGDPMQQIYNSGVGLIEVDDSWVRLEKPENYRCGTEILDLINKVRFNGDGGPRQIGRRTETVDGQIRKVVGTSDIFLADSSYDRGHSISRVRELLSQRYRDPSWLEDSAEADVRVLVIEHRHSAARLGFSGLFEAFYDFGTDSMKSAFTEGTAWPLSPFRNVLIPVALAVRDHDQFALTESLRNHSPRFNSLGTTEEPRRILSSLSAATYELSEMFAEGSNSTIRDVLCHAVATGVCEVDDRILTAIESADEDRVNKVLEENIRSDFSVMARFLSCPAVEAMRHELYQATHSVYSTQHAVKGSEFSKVVVVLDDQSSKIRQYSYDKLLGLEPPSDTDRENIQAGRDSALDRTRRLFYVCCSRAIYGLAVVWFTHDVEASLAGLSEVDLFPHGEIHVVDNVW